MGEYYCYIKIIESILKYKKNEKYETIIPIFLNKMYYEYYINRNLKEYNLDNLYKKYLPLLYITLMIILQKWHFTSATFSFAWPRVVTSIYRS